MGPNGMGEQAGCCEISSLQRNKREMKKWADLNKADP